MHIVGSSHSHFSALPQDIKTHILMVLDDQTLILCERISKEFLKLTITTWNLKAQPLNHIYNHKLRMRLKELKDRCDKTLSKIQDMEKELSLRGYPDVKALSYREIYLQNEARLKIKNQIDLLNIKCTYLKETMDFYNKQLQVSHTDLEPSQSKNRYFFHLYMQNHLPEKESVDGLLPLIFAFLPSSQTKSKTVSFSSEYGGFITLNALVVKYEKGFAIRLEWKNSSQTIFRSELYRNKISRQTLNNYEINYLVNMDAVIKTSTWSIA